MSSFSYGFQTGIGLNPYLLKHIGQVFGADNAPDYKVNYLGFLNLLQSQKKTLQMNRPNSGGAIDFLQVKYKQRLVRQMTGTSDTCSNAMINPYLEATVPLNGFRQINIYIEDALIQEYTTDANQTVMMGLPPTSIMKELLDQMMSATNAILEGVNIDLQNMLVFGINPNTGNNNAVGINITQNITTLPLTDGLTQLLTQCQKALFAPGKPQIYGGGLFLNFMNQQNAKGLAQNGLDTKIEAMGVDFYFDQDAPNILGTNTIAAFSPDAVQLVEFDRFTGNYGGQKGTSYFGNFVLPMKVGPTNVVPVSFDYQLRYIDCADGVAQINDYYGTPIAGFRGWQMMISKKFGLFQPPTNAYRASDNLFGSNGVLRFDITNN